MGLKEERTVQKAIKEAAKRNDMVSAKALAKEIVSSRRTVNKLYENKAQMNSISMHLGESIVMSRLARNRMQQPGYNLEGNSFDWDNIEIKIQPFTILITTSRTLRNNYGDTQETTTLHHDSCMTYIPSVKYLYLKCNAHTGNYPTMAA
ncbi:hypothetical protein Bca52824_080867 [Brassica carinata]|uniref:Uncharacterized protein n=1 Tax=Brassica carinata TaxID=52824 RepID=A0A8X7TSN0_BRACI|nr:hypothetical protein Bca52824_080867 [Brassica carinata]